MADQDEKCGDEFTLRYGYFCELPKGHKGEHEAQCPNPQFYQRWSSESTTPEDGGKVR